MAKKKSPRESAEKSKNRAATQTTTQPSDAPEPVDDHLGIKIYKRSIGITVRTGSASRSSFEFYFTMKGQTRRAASLDEIKKKIAEFLESK